MPRHSEETKGDEESASALFEKEPEIEADSSPALRDQNDGAGLPRKAVVSEEGSG